MKMHGMVDIRRQRGAFMVMMALLIVVLIGIAALALDVGRVVALRAEMQNAVDAAALAGAVELNGKDGARLRARAAARNALIHDSRYAQVAELLGDTALPDEAFEYFCIIGAKNDVSDDDAPGYCAGSATAPRLWPATNDAETHYLRVRLDPEVADHFRIDLIFLPVLQVFGIDPATVVALSATATAGRHFYECNYPPMVLCDPFEGTGTTFKEAMVAGQAIKLRDQGGGASFWASGNFGFLVPRSGDPGAPEVALYLADEGLTGCSPPRIETEPGQMTGPTTSAINTRFDQYNPPHPFNSSDAPARWPPAPNVMAYGNDATNRPMGGAVATSDRFGNGDWDFDAYWAAYHAPAPKPNAWSNANRPKRWDVYMWEIDNGAIPVSGQPDPAHLYTGDYPPPRSVPERRVLHVAVASCITLGIHGSSEATLYEPDGFAQLFLYRPADGPPSATIYAEYMGWSTEEDAHYHVDVQLYQ